MTTLIATVVVITAIIATAALVVLALELRAARQGLTNAAGELGASIRSVSNAIDAYAVEQATARHERRVAGVPW